LIWTQPLWTERSLTKWRNSQGWEESGGHHQKRNAGEIEFSESLRRRVSFLKGLKIKSLESIARTFKLTKGAKS